MRHTKKLIVIGISLAALTWLAWPFYEFYAHRDAVPLGPVGWKNLPEDPPESQVVHDPTYANKADRGMEVLRQHRQRLHTPALSAAVAIDGRLVWAGAVGWADIESQSPATSATRFRVGSTSKALTATGLARLGAAWLDESYIGQATRNAFWTPQRLANGETNLQDYCLGWRVRAYEVDGYGIAHNANHGGVSRGALSWLLVFPDYDMAIAFNTNSKTRSGEFHDFAHTWQDLFKAFAVKPPTSKVSASPGFPVEARSHLPSGL